MAMYKQVVTMYKCHDNVQSSVMTMYKQAS